MKRTIKLFALFFVAGSLSSCITMQSVSITDVKPSSGSEVSSSAGGLGILGLTTPKGLAEKATEEIRNKGAVGNVSTVMTMRNWGVVQYYKVSVVGTAERK